MLATLPETPVSCLEKKKQQSPESLDLRSHRPFFNRSEFRD